MTVFSLILTAGEELDGLMQQGTLRHGVPRRRIAGWPILAMKSIMALFLHFP
jgi:hypothetical protein